MFVAAVGLWVFVCDVGWGVLILMIGLRWFNSVGLCSSLVCMMVVVWVSVCMVLSVVCDYCVEFVFGLCWACVYF